MSRGIRLVFHPGLPRAGFRLESLPPRRGPLQARRLDAGRWLPSHLAGTPPLLPGPSGLPPTVKSSSGSRRRGRARSGPAGPMRPLDVRPLARRCCSALGRSRDGQVPPPALHRPPPAAALSESPPCTCPSSACGRCWSPWRSGGGRPGAGACVSRVTKLEPPESRGLHADGGPPRAALPLGRPCSSFATGQL